MSILNIKLYNDPVLRKKTRLVQKISEIDKKFISDMIETMYAQDGMGLAAPQVGVSLRLCVISANQKKGEELVVINPRIIKKIGRETTEEGCLSLPGVSAKVKRAFKIGVRFNTLEGHESMMPVEGLPARVFQHEIDHLDGILFIDRLNFLSRTKVLKKLKKLKKLKCA